jgi:hypothetical protein
MKTQCINSNNDAEFPTYLFPVHTVSRTKTAVFHPWRSHLSGMSWWVPSGNVLRMVMGSTAASSSLRAMSIGFERALDGPTSIGAPIAIWRALAPTIRAFSKRVSFGGPIQNFLSPLVSLVRPDTLRPHSRRPLWGPCWLFHFARCNYVVDF